MQMPKCPRCDSEMIWQNDWDYGTGEENEETYTDYLCKCGVSVTIPWEREDIIDDQ